MLTECWCVGVTVPGDQEFLSWRRKTSASLYVRLLSGDDILSPLPPEAFSVPMVVLPACSLTPHFIIQVSRVYWQSVLNRSVEFVELFS
jgi:hypothetical protein